MAWPCHARVWPCHGAQWIREVPVPKTPKYIKKVSKKLPIIRAANMLIYVLSIGWFQIDEQTKEKWGGAWEGGSIGLGAHL